MHFYNFKLIYTNTMNSMEIKKNDYNIMNLNSDDYYSRTNHNHSFSLSLVSDGERVKGGRSPSPKVANINNTLAGHQSQDHTFIKDDPHGDGDHHSTVDPYIDDMKKGISNILVSSHRETHSYFN